MSAPSQYAPHRLLVATFIVALQLSPINHISSLHAQQSGSDVVRTEIPSTLRLLVVPYTFRIHEPIPGRSRDKIEELIFGPYPSLDHYFRSNSLGKFKIEGSVTDWISTIATEPTIMVPSGLNYFWAMDMAFDSVATMVDLEEFDTDSDNIIDAMIFLHSMENNYSWSADEPDEIWEFRDLFFEACGYHIGWYLLAPASYGHAELIQLFADHYFHFPRTDDPDGSSSGLGAWSRLSGAGGNMDAYSRFRIGWLGFNTIDETRRNHTLYSEPLSPSRVVLRLVPDYSNLNEFFLLEYRRKEGYDSNLPGEGLLIYHVDNSVNSMSDETHPRVRIIQADGLQDLEAGRRTGDDGDPFPGISMVFSVPDQGPQPSLQTYSGEPSGFSISDIRLFPDHLVLSIGVDEVLPDREKYLDPEQDLVIYPTVVNLSSPGAMFSFVNQSDQSMDIDIIDRGGRILTQIRLLSRQTYDWLRQDWDEIYPLPTILLVRVTIPGKQEQTRKLMIMP